MAVPEEERPALRLNVERLYRRFSLPVTDFDCGLLCAPHNPNRIPVCCDICHAVPAAYRQEWEYLQAHTDLWHPWRGDECAADPSDPALLLDQTPEHMLLLACLGPEHCQRQYRAVSCRQFPFFPYISSKDRFLGLAYDWDFEDRCWVISHLGAVSDAFRREFVDIFDELLAVWYEEYESYANLSEDMRLHFATQRRRIPLLHRNGGIYLLSPGSERLQRLPPERLPRFGPYCEKSSPSRATDHSNSSLYLADCWDLS